MEQSPSSETNLSSSSQKILLILWNLEVHYRIHISPPIFPILSQINPVNAYPSHLLDSHFNIIFESLPTSSKLSLWIVPFHQNPLCTFPLSLTCHMICPFIRNVTQTSITCYVYVLKWEDLHNHHHCILYLVINKRKQLSFFKAFLVIISVNFQILM